jgi:hypothetical protein
LNRGWHEEWFYIKNPEQLWFPAFTGAHPVKKKGCSWGASTAEKRWLVFHEATLRERVTEGGLNGALLFYTFHSRLVIPLAKRSARMWDYSGHVDHDRVLPVEITDDDVFSRIW